MMFPLWKFWRYTPYGWCAALIWNISELFGFRLPRADLFFNLIVMREGKRHGQ